MVDVEAHPEMERCSGAMLRQLLSGGLAALERCAEAVNRLNVFPVPDGDTGTNMLLTLRSAAQEVTACPAEDIATVAQALARGALMGARGNSGVILSQICQGLATGLAGREQATAQEWAAAWGEATRAAYRSVTNPVEGTILTVVRALAEGAGETAKGGASFLPVLRASLSSAQAAVAETPNLLATLREAEVVDAGGLGLQLILAGGLAALAGEPLPDPQELPVPTQRTERVIVEADFPRYCTEVWLQGQGLALEAVRDRLASLGDSLEVVWFEEGASPGLHVHIHSDEPQAVFSSLARLGTVLRTKADDMQAQRERYRGEILPRGLAVVATGHGMERLFGSLHGVQSLIAGGPTMNPSVAELAAGLERAPVEELLLLPNDTNILLAAQQAMALSRKMVRVVPTNTMPEGIAAALTFDAWRDLEGNAQAMAQAAAAVRTVAVTYAERDVAWGARTAVAGQPIAVAGKEILAAGDDLVSTAEAGVAAVSKEAELATIYFGAQSGPAEARELAERLQRRFPSLEVEVVEGGQPHYPFIIGLE